MAFVHPYGHPPQQQQQQQQQQQAAAAARGAALETTKKLSPPLGWRVNKTEIQFFTCVGWPYQNFFFFFLVPPHYSDARIAGQQHRPCKGHVSCTYWATFPNTQGGGAFVWIQRQQMLKMVALHASSWGRCILFKLFSALSSNLYFYHMIIFCSYYIFCICIYIHIIQIAISTFVTCGVRSKFGAPTPMRHSARIRGNNWER